MTLGCRGPAGLEDQAEGCRPIGIGHEGAWKGVVSDGASMGQSGKGLDNQPKKSGLDPVWMDKGTGSSGRGGRGLPEKGRSRGGSKGTSGAGVIRRLLQEPWQ